MNDIAFRHRKFTFSTKAKGEEFCKALRNMVNKYDVVTCNDVLEQYGDVGKFTKYYNIGYNKSEIKKLKVIKENTWVVEFPAPGRMIRDKNGYWTTEPLFATEEV